MHYSDCLIKAFILCLVSTAFTFFECSASPGDTAPQLRQLVQTTKPADSDVTVRILCTGDIMSHIPLVNSAWVPAKKQWDFSPLFEIVAPLLKSDDMTIGNLETVMAGDHYGIKGFPDFNAPQALAYGLQTSGFDFLTTCNNHSFDMGLKGLTKTLQRLDSLGILHTGTFMDSTPADRSCVVEIKGIKLGILAYAYRTNGKLPRRLARHMNLIDTAAIHGEIQKLKSKKVHGIICVMHFGEEYQNLPSREQKSLVRFLWKNGVDVVIGHHPPVVQPVLYDSLNNRFAAFSLGNFFTAQRNRNRDFGAIADITLLKKHNDSTVSIKRADVIITTLCRWSDSNRIRYTVLPLDSAVISNLPQNYPKNWKKKLDTLPYFKKHLKSLDGKFVYDSKPKTDTSGSGRRPSHP
jgi:poly-gamma-glutamate capsule biosynthesis protein CapA/YwtB (metallophosphatase superfamily)